jgi:hypothetical protein
MKQRARPLTLVETPSPRQVLQDARESFLERGVARNLAPRTLEFYRTRLGSFVLWRDSSTLCEGARGPPWKPAVICRYGTDVEPAERRQRTMRRNWLMVAGFIVAALGLCVFVPMGRAGKTAGSGTEGGQLSDEALEDALQYVVALLDASPLKGLGKVEASLYVGPINSEWEEVLGVSAAQVDKHVKSRVGAIEGLDATGSEFGGDPSLSLDIEPLIERDETGKPARVFVSVALRLDEWVMAERPGDDWGFNDVMATTWQEHRLVSGAPAEVGKTVMAAANELFDAFGESYHKSNSPPPATDAE